MFSYTVNVRKINSASKLKGIASIVIDDIMEIDGFKIIEGSNGLFVSVPSHKGTILEDGQKVEKYFDDIRFKNENGASFSKELKDSILNSYASSPVADSLASSSNSETPSKTKINAARETAAQSDPGAITSRERKPLWGF